MFTQIGILYGGKSGSSWRRNYDHYTISFYMSQTMVVPKIKPGTFLYLLAHLLVSQR